MKRHTDISAQQGAAKMPRAVAPDAPGRERVLWLDVIRAFAIIGIVLTHCMSGRAGADSLTLTLMFAGSASLFFMTSGALIFPVRPDARHFLRRRLWRVVPQLVLWTVIYAVLQWYFDPTYSLQWRMTWVFFVPAWGEGWFLYVLVSLYLIAPVISPWLCAAPRRAVEVFLLIWMIAGLTPLASANIAMLPWQTPVATYFGYLGYMVAGYYLTRWPVGQRPARQRLLFYAVLILAGVVLALRLLVTARQWGYARTLTDDTSFNIMAVCMLWFALLQHVRRLPARAAAVVRLVSLCSFGIYLVHPILLRYVPWISGLSLWPAFAVVLVVSLVAAQVLRWLRLSP